MYFIIKIRKKNHFKSTQKINKMIIHKILISWRNKLKITDDPNSQTDNTKKPLSGVRSFWVSLSPGERCWEPLSCRACLSRSGWADRPRSLPPPVQVLHLTGRFLPGLEISMININLNTVIGPHQGFQSESPPLRRGWWPPTIPWGEYSTSNWESEDVWSRSGTEERRQFEQFIKI